MLNIGDNIQFVHKDRTLYYEVEFAYLHHRRGVNSDIFELLGIEDKHRFCSIAYGYDADNGDFPTCINDDMEALTRVYNALQKLCVNPKINPKIQKLLDEQ